MLYCISIFMRNYAIFTFVIKTDKQFGLYISHVTQSMVRTQCPADIACLCSLKK